MPRMLECHLVPAELAALEERFGCTILSMSGEYPWNHRATTAYSIEGHKDNAQSLVAMIGATIKMTGCHDISVVNPGKNNANFCALEVLTDDGKISRETLDKFNGLQPLKLTDELARVARSK